MWCLASIYKAWGSWGQQLKDGVLQQYPLFNSGWQQVSAEGGLVGLDGLEGPIWPEGGHECLEDLAGSKCLQIAVGYTSLQGMWCLASIYKGWGSWGQQQEDGVLQQSPLFNSGWQQVPADSSRLYKYLRSVMPGCLSTKVSAPSRYISELFLWSNLYCTVLYIHLSCCHKYISTII